MPQTISKSVDAATSDREMESLHIHQEIEINAPIAKSWQALLDELGPEGQMPDGSPNPIKLEAWPGGRLFRDLGDNAGHFWGHVQVIKPPTLLEICGPLFMSYPAMNHIQYRLVADGKKTKLSFTHRGVGQILPEHREGVNKGWQMKLNRVRELAERE